MNEDLRTWFRQKWVRMDTKGKIKGPCAREDGEGKPKCLPAAKARSMSKQDRATAARRKRREDPVADRRGKGNKPVMVNTEEFMMEGNEPTNPSLWSKAKALAKKKFDVYPSAYANGWAAKYYKSKGGGWKSVSEETVDEACWKGYKRVGMKKKGDRMVPNCVPEATDIIAKAKAKIAEAKKEHYPREGFPEEGDYGYHPNPGLKPQESDKDEDMDVAYKKATEKEGRKPLNAKITEGVEQHEDDLPFEGPYRKVGVRKDQYGNKVKNVAKHLAKKAMKANEETELDEASYSHRDYASHGLMHPDMAKHMKVGRDTDYYLPGNGDKHSGRVTKNDGNSVHIRAEKDGRIGAGPLHKFKVTPHLPKKTNEETDLEEKWMVKKGTEVVSTHKTKDEADVKAMKHPLYKVYAKEETEHENCGTPDCCGECDTAIEESIANMSDARLKYHATKDFPHGRYTSKEIKAEHDRRRKAVPNYHTVKPSLNEEEMEEAYGMWKVDFPKQHAGKAVAAGSVHVKAQNTAHAHKVAAKRVGVDHKVFKSKVTKSSILPEELGKDNEWGRPELRKKFAAMTPGQEGMTADKIPTFDPRYDDVTTQYCGGIKEGFLAEISARGAEARAKFQAKIHKTLNDPAAIKRAKKALAKKAKIEKEKEPAHLVMQLRKAVSVGSKVHFRDGSHHQIAPNHADRFMAKYNSAKSAIEKEALQKRAHASHSEFMKTIAEEVETPQGNGPEHELHMGNGGHIGTVEASHEDMRFGDVDSEELYAELEKEVENLDWEDIVDLYDPEEIEYKDDEEEDEDEDEGEEECGCGEMSEAITPAGRLKKKFNAMRTKSRRMMARNIAIKRVSTPDRIKARSIRAARRMVYKRLLRNRDISTVSAAEKTRIEAQIKRMAPMVARLSVRVMPQVRKLEQSRIKNSRMRKKK